MQMALRLNGFSKTNSCAAVAVQKVRRELLRLGCSPSDINVKRRRTQLKLTYDGQEFVASPLAIMSTLKSVKKPVQAIDVWAILWLSNQQQLKKLNKNKLMIVSLSRPNPPLINLPSLSYSN